MSRAANRPRKQILGAFSIGLALTLGLLPALLKPKPAISAEKVHLTYGPLDFSLSVDSLEVFAKEGKITNEFKFYARRLDAKTLAMLRQALQKRLDVSPVTLSQLTYVNMAEVLLTRLGILIQPTPGVNGFQAMRAALILAATDPDGFTILNVLRRFPTKDIWVSGEIILSLAKQVSVLPGYRDAIVQAVTQQAATEAASEPAVNVAQLTDLSKPGPYRVTKTPLTFKVNAVRQTQQGLVGSYNLDVDLYLPEGLGKPAAIVVVTHGFGSNRDSYGYIAQHLASHGFAAAAPEHIGSDLAYRQALLKGGLGVDISPLEFVSRPLDITYMLNEFERLVATDPQWAQRLNLQQIGILGNSFGGTTALTVAGATINQARLSQECGPDKHVLNASALLQCRASYLPPQEYRVGDPRVKAAFAAYPLTNVVFGPEGMGTINIPTFIMAGSRDIFTPVIVEQIHPFIWLTSPTKYLGLMTNGTHFSTAEDAVSQRLPGFLRSPRPDLGRSYFKALSVAFFHVYLENQAAYQPYLTSKFADGFSQDPLKLHVIRSLTPNQLQAAYGGPPPLPIIPKSAVAAPAQRSVSVLQEVQRTGVLRVAIRSDAAPFGYVDPERDVWTGYCSELSTALAAHLSRRLNGSKVDVITLPATLENRFQLVQNNTVQLVCGPDTVRRDVKGVTFSTPFFTSGTQFLARSDKSAQINPTGTLEGLRIGVLKQSLTESFVQKTYPKSTEIYFEGASGRSDAIQSLANGDVDAIASDGVLLVGELARQKRSLTDFTLLPKQPLTCDFYGLVLPDNDRQWREFVNAFIVDQAARTVRQQWLSNAIPAALSDTNYCLNR